jgi:hypothetical protein
MVADVEPIYFRIWISAGHDASARLFRYVFATMSLVNERAILEAFPQECSCRAGLDSQ